LNIPDDLPLVRTTYRLHDAIEILIEEIDWLRLASGASVEAKQTSASTITIAITRTFRYDYFDFETFESQLSSQYGSYFPLQIASLIISENGSDLRISPIEGGVRFEFDLPIWKDE